jgi:3(or 17)beta-hydroxysteroid dehydrogenase
MGRVQGKVAIVTGAALGIGAATATLLAREGASVVVTDIKDAEGEQVRGSIGGDASYAHHGVTDETSWMDLIASTMARFGRLDILVNNAGLGWPSNPEEETLERWRLLMSVNLEGVFLGIKHAISAMKAKQPSGGSIVNISSAYGIVGGPNVGAYNASKGAVRLYTKSVALYCAQAGLGIRVNSVHPGFIWTPMVEEFLREQGNELEAGRQALGSIHPVGHVGQPQDIAYGVLYLASDESKFMTGAELVIDGGLTAQ